MMDRQHLPAHSRKRPSCTEKQPHPNFKNEHYCLTSQKQRAMRCKPEQIYRRMRYLVERDKLFLDPHLSLNRLSTITGTNTLYLSRAINVCTGHNFKTMLNDYRIEFAEALLKNNAAPRFSFKEFHTQCGFLSKSAFYSAFKKRMNMTPKEYLGWCMENADFSGGGKLDILSGREQFTQSEPFFGSREPEHFCPELKE